MFCQSCGNKISEGSKFCRSCGCRVAGSPSERPAPHSQPPPPPPRHQPPSSPVPPPPQQPVQAPPASGASPGKNLPLIVLSTALLIVLVGVGIWYFALRDRDVMNGQSRSPKPPSSEQAPPETLIPNGDTPPQPSPETTPPPTAEDFAWLKVDSIDGIISLDAATLDYPDILGRWKAVIIGYRGVFAEETEQVYMFLDIEEYDAGKHGYAEGVNTAVLFYSLYVVYADSPTEKEFLEEDAPSQSAASFGYSTLSVVAPHNPDMVFDLFFWEENGIQYAQHHYHAPEGTDESSYLIALVREKP